MNTILKSVNGDKNCFRHGDNYEEALHVLYGNRRAGKAPYSQEVKSL